MINADNPKKTSQSSKMWGGRFEKGPSKLMKRINESISFDKRLYKQDIEASIAHTRMLKKQKIISSNDCKNIISGLKIIQKEIEDKSFPFKTNLEDIHMNIEDRLKSIIGPSAGRIHTARSRNDQVATDLKLWTRDSIEKLNLSLRNLQRSLIDKAELNFETIMPGFTHMQIAQPITFGHYLMAYVEMFGRDRSRYTDCSIRLNECPLGSAALAGTSFPIDRKMTAKELNFLRPTFNSLDTVSDRDFVVEFLFVSSLTSIHLSRLAEELILWCSDQFNFIKISDDFTTGSSIMPQKRNPDAAELIRGKSGRILGSLVSLITVLKGLPLAYSKDLQEDKESVFDCFDSLHLIVSAMEGIISDLEPNKSNMLNSLRNGYPTATDLADWLVRELKIPFREAHKISGKVVKLAENLNCSLDELSINQFKKIDSRINKNVINILSIENSLNSKTSFGGTSPKEVKKQIKEARKRFL